ncbi:MAG: uroporphyrinogen-III C-methyltransferase [Paenibacillaceae bacterium]|uniref:Uroporphyrinogen-III C-methyltransferase n=1 Tax=Paenibacillus mellifer TaxID=2937794 RepID=A0A9X1Y2T4_9BACL|nr:uroporphyrinogen-III C-methyltransferase [Paenibacillus mellifer]MBW4840869.1 uroporphyrinogen-III C-methyltransferase [Paenibacillaceae bacterium]MCK8486412.1 uroporphyrinogen-III C-methyltransferase [Paenibacillus mellifer]
MKGPGTVSIVGAGPGDSELITVKAMKRLREAEVVLYDRLISEELLAYAGPCAELVYCGKAPGRHAMPQEDIHRRLVGYALEGKRVVRLKGGDPFVFGRGGEEALALAAAGIPYEVIPGITSALGAAASAGVPLTHRGAAASFACVTGTRCHGDRQPIRWDLLAQGVDTLAIYMGVSQIAAIRSELLRHGKAAQTPVALIESGTTRKQRTFICTLDDMHKLAAAVKLSNPALILVGEVVRVREQLQQFEHQAEVYYGS